MPSQITLPIVGVQFPNARGASRRFAVDLQRPGDPVELRREPKNPADPNAIAVHTVEGVQMGYVPAERAPYIGMMMTRGAVTAIFQGADDFGAFIRIGFDEEPVLPDPSPAARKPRATDGPASQAPEQEWYPDPEYPDDV
jgi:hypothetical protein